MNRKTWTSNELEVLRSSDNVAHAWLQLRILGRSETAVRRKYYEERWTTAPPDLAVSLLCTESTDFFMDAMYSDKPVAPGSPTVTEGFDGTEGKKRKRPTTFHIGPVDIDSLPPRAITTKARRVPIGLPIGWGVQMGISNAFEDINRLLKGRRDARGEAMDGLPRYM